MRSRYGLCTLLLAVGLLGSGCGSEEPEPAKPVLSVFEARDPADGAAGPASEAAASVTPGETPVVERVDFVPSRPESRDRLRAVARVSGDWSALQYTWTRNGERFGSNTAEIALPRLETGDVIAVTVTPFQDDRPGEPRKIETTVSNQRPKLTHLTIERVDEPEGAAIAGEIWRADVRAEDPDGDPVEYEYRWMVNGEVSDVDVADFPADRLRAGDRIELRARAFDGEAWSVPANSGEIVVGNSLPVIVSRPPRPDANGQFRYQVRVKDSGGDRGLRFSLRRSPRGMQIDGSTGLVTWQPETDQAGEHEVEVVVRDADGGEASQAFRLALVATTEAAPAAPR
jgi:hypothetical protein